MRVRLAPSPTGTLHLGTARTAIFNWLFAKNNQGKFLIRIEDTDKERSKKEFTENILQGLKWLGISWDEKPVIQSERISEHKEAIRTLMNNGMAYRCYATESEIDEMREHQKLNGEPPRYDNRYRDLTQEKENELIKKGRDSVIRFRIDDNKQIKWNDLIRGEMIWKGKDLGGDMVISRRAPSNEIGDPLYNLVVVVDDSAMRITHVIRGEDHIANTAKQILLYEALNLNLPEFAHTPLILNQEGKKLSKRDGVTSINDFKEMGYTSEAIANYMTLLGWSVPEGKEERFNISDIYEIFNFERVNKAGARFDWEKLNWLNSQVIHDMSPELLLDNLIPIWNKEGWEIKDKSWALELAKLIGPSMTVLKDGIHLARPFFKEPNLESDGAQHLGKEGVESILKAVIFELEKKDQKNLSEKDAIEIINAVTKSTNSKKGLVMKSLRASLLGTLNGPDLITTWLLLSRIGKGIVRIRRCI